jgi:hypothetical protein
MDSDTPSPHIFTKGDIYFTNAGLQLVKFTAAPGQMILVKEEGLELVHHKNTKDQASQGSTSLGTLNGNISFSINLDNNKG